MSEGLHDLIRSFGGVEAGDAAELVLDALNIRRPRQRALLFAVVRDECRRVMRSDTRRIEHGLSVEVPPSSRASRSDWLAERFYNGSAYVTWGAATADDHLARIDYLETLQAGLQSTIDRHREAVDQITVAGVVCLAEIEAVAA